MEQEEGSYSSGARLNLEPERTAERQGWDFTGYTEEL